MMEKVVKVQLKEKMKFPNNFLTDILLKFPLSQQVFSCVPAPKWLA